VWPPQLAQPSLGSSDDVAGPRAVRRYTTPLTPPTLARLRAQRAQIKKRIAALETG
jgi:hypothetical protein